MKSQKKNMKILPYIVMDVIALVYLWFSLHELTFNNTTSYKNNEVPLFLLHIFGIFYEFFCVCCVFLLNQNVTSFWIVGPGTRLRVTSQ